jgi:transcriptional regulator with XRE-family HTH domain
MPMRKDKLPLGDSVINSRLAKRIKTFRINHDLSRVDVGKALGYTITEYTDRRYKGRTGCMCSVMSPIESGASRIPLDKLYILSKLYRISIDVFFQDAEPKIDMYDKIAPHPSIELIKEKDVTMAVCKKIRYLRMLQGYTETEISVILGYGYPSSVSELELGKCKIQPAALYRLARLFHVPVSEFFKDLEGAI